MNKGPVKISTHVMLDDEVMTTEHMKELKDRALGKQVKEEKPNANVKPE